MKKLLTLGLILASTAILAGCSSSTTQPTDDQVAAPAADQTAPVAQPTDDQVAAPAADDQTAPAAQTATPAVETATGAAQ